VIISCVAALSNVLGEQHVKMVINVDVVIAFHSEHQQEILRKKNKIDRLCMWCLLSSIMV